MKTELFLPVLEWLEAGAPHKNEHGLVFNMESFFYSEGEAWDKEHCGTACCIAGAVNQFNKLNVDNYSADAACYEIGELIGMTKKQVDNLFLGHTPAGLTYPLDAIPPQLAASVLRTFIETGYAPWPEELPE